jgi:hypothetical protein
MTNLARPGSFGDLRRLGGFPGLDGFGDVTEAGGTHWPMVEETTRLPW